MTDTPNTPTDDTTDHTPDHTTDLTTDDGAGSGDAVAPESPVEAVEEELAAEEM